MHILLLVIGLPSTYSPLEGIFFLDQAKALAKYGHQTGIISINPVSLKDILRKGTQNLGKQSTREDGVTLEVYRYPSMPKNRTQIIKKLESKGVPEVAAYIEKYGKPDVVHVHNYEAAHLAILVKQKYGIPYVLTEHSTHFLANTVPASLVPYARKAYAESYANLAVSEQFAQIMQKFSGKPFRVLENVTDTALFAPSHKPKDRFAFFSAGALIPRKNQALQIEAFARIFPRLAPDTQLWIGGEGPDETKLKTLAAGLGVEKNVVFTGGLTREQVKDRMQAASAYLLSSLNETFGVVIIEAMSCGLPVVSTRCVGPETIIRNESQGLLTDFSVEAFADAMWQLYEYPEKYAAAELRQYVEDTYSERAIAQKLTGVYLEATNQTV